MEILIALAGFAFISCATPGPNNVLLLSSGLRFGFWLSLPHILGIQFGIILQLVLSAVGLAAVLEEVPEAALALKVFGSAYLLYLAWQLRENRVADSCGDGATPFSFTQAVLFQFVNPKAWMMTLTAGSLFLPKLESQSVSILVMCLVFSLVGTPSSGSWVFLGSAIKRLLKNPLWQRCFSWGMVIITLYTAVGLWFIN